MSEEKLITWASWEDIPTSAKQRAARIHDMETKEPAEEKRLGDHWRDAAERAARRYDVVKPFEKKNRQASCVDEETDGPWRFYPGTRWGYLPSEVFFKSAASFMQMNAKEQTPT